MSKFSKVLSVLLAMVMLFSMASVGVEAAYNAYKDTAITRYDTIDKPVLTPAQYASMAMDEVDRMLGEANLKIEYDLAGLITIGADLTSVDKALDSVADLYNSIKSMLSTIGGDIEDLDFSALVNADGTLACPKRTTAGKTDADIFLSLLEFLADNAEIIGKVPKGSAANGGLDLGILSGFVDLGDKLNVPKLVKELLAGFVWPDTAKADLDTSKSVDEYVKLFIDEVASGEYARFTEANKTIARGSELIARYLPGITDEIDLLNDSVYDIINKGVKIALNNVAVPYANPRLKAALNRLCGYDYIKTVDEDGDTLWVPNPDPHDELNALVNVVNTNFNLSPFPVASWGNDWIFDHLNDIAGQIVREAINSNVSFTWDYSRGNEALVDNIIAVAKAVLKIDGIGDELFASYVEVLSADEIDAMDDDEFIAYILRSILNGTISDVYIPNTCTTTMEVLFELVRTLAADLIPSQSYYNMDADLDNMIQIGLDVAAYGLNGITNMDLDYGMDVEDFSDACMDWVIENYGGFLETIEGNDGWEKLSYVVFNLIPANWLSTREDGSERDNVYDLIFTDIVDNILNFDLASVLKLVDQNEDGELNDTIIEVIMARLTSIVNFVLPGVFPSADYSKLENLLDPNLLSSIIENLLGALYDRASNGLLDALIPVACAVLGLSDPESFGYPYISLEDQKTVGQVMLSSFYMYNGSSGLNTNATDKYGNTPQTPDKLYTYYIRSVVTNNGAVTVSPAGNIYINGGTSQTFTLGNVSAAKDSVLKVTITYDVLSEKGTVMTPQPLTATTYTYIYDSVNITEDDERAKVDGNPKNMHVVYYKPTTYMSVDSKLSSLADYTIDAQRNKYKDSTLHNANATISVSNVQMDARLTAAGVSANTNFSYTTDYKGGSKEYSPYKVTNGSATLDEGTYTNRFFFSATATESETESISLMHNIFVYDDFGLGSLLKSAVSADRQEANYGTGSFEAEYPEFGSDPDDEDPNMVSETVNGTAAWERYTEAVDAAAAIVYAPKQVGTMQGFVDDGAFEAAAMELYCATKELEACSTSSGTAGIKSALEEVVPSDTYINSDNEEVSYDYDDANYPYFGRADYINYTYSNFKSEMRTAERILDAEKAAKAKNEDYQIEAIRAAYVAHRVSLYGERLIRVKAYKTHLAKAINDYTPLFNTNNTDGSGNAIYSNKTWNEFVRAYNFATQVNGEAIGATVSASSENLAGDGLRQTKVNEARSHLIKTAKRLVAAKPLVDYTQILALIASVKATYDAGIENYTELSWNTFKAAYLAALRIVEDELELSDSNQTKVNNALNALQSAFDALEEIVMGGEWSFDPDTLIATTTTLFSEYNYVHGLYDFYINVSDFISYSGIYTVEVEVNEYDMESTGALVKVYSNGDLVGEYPIVFYSDVNGDGVTDTTDTSEMADAMATIGLTDWEDFVCADENAHAMAADMNHDAVIDTSDISIVEDVIGYVIVYNQAYEDGDEIYEELF